MKTTLLVTIAMLTSLFSHANPLEVGQDAPAVSGINQDSQTVDLGAVFSSGLTLVFFYPMADTPGCTDQACSLRDSFQELVDKEIRVFGVSTDKPEKQKAFKEGNLLPFDLIADTDKVVSKAFGRGRWDRQAYLIQDGKVIWRDLKASTKTQAADFKTALEELGIAKFAP